jgi:hypothetical protein
MCGAAKGRIVERTQASIAVVRTIPLPTEDDERAARTASTERQKRCQTTNTSMDAVKHIGCVEVRSLFSKVRTVACARRGRCRQQSRSADEYAQRKDVEQEAAHRFQRKRRRRSHGACSLCCDRCSFASAACIRLSARCTSLQRQ